MHSARNANPPSLGEGSGLSAAHRAHREMNHCSDSRVLMGPLDQAGGKTAQVVKHYWFKNTLCRGVQKTLQMDWRASPGASHSFLLLKTHHSSTNQGGHCYSSEWGQATALSSCCTDLNDFEEATLEQLSKTVTEAPGSSFSSYFVLVQSSFISVGLLIWLKSKM